MNLIKLQPFEHICCKSEYDDLPDHGSSFAAATADKDISVEFHEAVAAEYYETIREIPGARPESGLESAFLLNRMKLATLQQWINQGRNLQGLDLQPSKFQPHLNR